MMFWETVTYDDLVGRYGRDMAFDFLLTVEKMANVNSNIIEVDEAARLQRALNLLDKKNMAA